VRSVQIHALSAECITDITYTQIESKEKRKFLYTVTFIFRITFFELRRTGCTKKCLELFSSHYFHSWFQNLFIFTPCFECVLNLTSCFNSRTWFKDIENKVLWRIFGLKRDKIMKGYGRCTKKHCNFYSLPNTYLES
jgi:hypothetical protein